MESRHSVTAAPGSGPGPRRLPTRTAARRSVAVWSGHAIRIGRLARLLGRSDRAALPARGGRHRATMGLAR